MAIVYKILLKVVFLAILAQADKNFRVVDAVAGDDAKTPMSGVHLAKDMREWNRMWVAIQGDVVTAIGPTGTQNRVAPPPPSVDFEKNVVVGVFGGPVPNVLGYEVVGFDGKAAKASVRLRPVFSRTTNVMTIQNPYVVLILPRTNKEVEIQMLVPSRGQPQFKTISTLPKTVKEKEPVVNE